MHTTIELTLRRLADGSLSVDARLTSDASVAPAMLVANVPVILDEEALLAAAGDDVTYGSLLSSRLFADSRLREAWLRALTFAATGSLQLRLNLDVSDEALHALRWETLRDPESEQPIALQERVRLVRTLDSADLTSEARLTQTSRISSKPPSSDLSSAPSPPAKKSPRKPKTKGAQPNHLDQQRELLLAEEVTALYPSAGKLRCKRRDSSLTSTSHL